MPRMKLIIFILSILSWDLAKVACEICSKPEVRRAQLYIYRTADVDVIVYHCYYDVPNQTYSDITKNCINAFNTAFFIDKWSDGFDTDDENSLVKLKKYTTKANTMENEIRLRSGTVCRYDRGFCYDPKESFNFAAVWEVTNDKPNINAENLIPIFYGYTDIWELKNKSLKYLVFQDSRKDLSFSLQIMGHHTLGGKDIWYTNRYGIIVSKENLQKNFKSVPRLSQEHFPLKPKRLVSEQVLESCDLQNFPLDFGKNINQSYILNQNNLAVILDIFQRELLDINKKLAVMLSDDKENPEINKAVTDLQNDMRNTKKLLLTKDQEIAKIQDTIHNMLNALSQPDPDISKLQQIIKEMLAQIKGHDVELNKVKEKLGMLQNQLSRLDYDSNGSKVNKEIAILKNNFTLLETTLLEGNKEIFKAISSKDKLIADTKNSLIVFYKELQNKDIELKKAQARLFTIEQDLNRQDNDIIKCKNYTNLILTQNQIDFNANVKGLGKLEQKYNGILAKLNLHDTEIRKCQNCTKPVLPNKEKLLKEIGDDIRTTQGAVLQLERKIKDLLNKDIELEKNVYEIDGITTKLKEQIAHERQEFIGMVNGNKNEIKMIKEKTEQCQRAIDQITNSKGEDSEEIQRNLTDLKNILFKQDKDILKLQGNLKEIYDKLSANDKDFDEAINDCKHYVNSKLQTKDEEITNIHEILIKKDGEIKKNYEHLRKIHETNKDLENKINRCRVDTDKKLKEKDDEIKQIQHNLDQRYQEFRTELKKRDQEYKKLEEKIKKIEQDNQNVDVV